MWPAKMNEVLFGGRGQKRESKRLYWVIILDSWGSIKSETLFFRRMKSKTAARLYEKKKSI